MGKAKRKEKRKRGKLYQSDAAFRFFLWAMLPITVFTVCLVVVPILIAILFGVWLIGPFPLLLAAIIAYACVWVCWSAYKSGYTNALFISESGIEFNVYGIRGFAAWEQLEMLGWKALTRSRIWGILWSETFTCSRSILSRLFGYASYYYGIIPLQLFEHVPHISWWNSDIDLDRFQETPLGQALYHHAPYLFDTVAEKPKRGLND